MFRKIDALRPGNFAILESKALQLAGGPTSPKPPADRDPYGLIVRRAEADLFPTYCTDARAAAAEVEGAGIVELPEAVAVGADDGLTVMTGAPEPAYRSALFTLSAKGQAILDRHGFAAPGLVHPGGSP